MYQATRIRQFRTERVMIRDNQFQPQFTSECRFLDAGDSAVHRDDQGRRILFVQRPQRLAVQAVTFLETMRYVVVNAGACQLQTVPQQAERRDSIDVVIAVQDNASARFDRGDNAIGIYASSDPYGYY